MPRTAGSALLVAFVAIGVFLPSVGGDFLNYDDDHYVLHSRPIRDGDLATILDPRASRAELGEEYLPVRDLTYTLDARLFGTDESASVGFRAVNLVWYALACALAFVFLERLLRDTPLALLGATFFAVHPVHAESAAWIASRKDVVSGALVFLALILQLRARGRGLGARMVAATVGALAMLAKSTALALPLLVGLVEGAAPALRAAIARRRGLDPEKALDDEDRAPLAKRLLRALGFVLPAAIVTANALLIATHAGIARPAPPGGLATTFATDAPILSRYIEIAFVPNSLRVSYAWPLRMSFGDPVVLGSLGVIAFAVACAVLSRRRAPLVAFGAAWFFLALSPNLNLVTWVQWMGERYLFLPILGTSLVLACLVDACRETWPRGALVATAGLVVAFGFMAGRRGLEFSTSERLWRSNVAIEPENPVARHHLGLALVKKAARAEEPEKRRALARDAEQEERRAIEIYARPEVKWAGHATEAKVGLALALDLQDDRDRALDVALEAAAQLPPRRNALVTLAGLCKLARDDANASGAQLAKAARGLALLGFDVDARIVFQRARSSDPDAAEKAAEDPVLRAVLDPRGPRPRDRGNSDAPPDVKKDGGPR